VAERTERTESVPPSTRMGAIVVSQEQTCPPNKAQYRGAHKTRQPPLLMTDNQTDQSVVQNCFIAAIVKSPDRFTP
jgi:hypothetical protein